MSNRFTVLFSMLAMLFASALATQSANAQSITLGGDDEQVFRILRSNGYTSPRITKRRLTIIRTEACKGANKFQVKISILGKITSVAKIGKCDLPPEVQKQAFSAQEAQSVLEQQGFSQIKAERRGRRVVATACRQNRRYELEFNRRGRVTQRQDLGQCPPEGLNTRQITEILEREGYRRITVTDNKLPKYVAEGCKERDRVRVAMNRRGIIRSERRIGRCGRQFNPENIVSMLEEQGYDRIEAVETRRPPYTAVGCKGSDRIEVTIGRFGRIRDTRRIDSCRTNIDPAQIADLLGKKGYDRVRLLRSKRAPYLAEACKNDNLLELTVGRYGRVRKEERVGRCAEPISEENLTAKLIEQGYVITALTRRNDGWRAEVCREAAKVAIRMDAYGDVLRERPVGECKSQTALEILKNLEGRGAVKTKLIVEGCYRGTKYRWEFDRLGNRTGRERAGGC